MIDRLIIKWSVAKLFDLLSQVIVKFSPNSSSGVLGQMILLFLAKFLDGFF